MNPDVPIPLGFTFSFAIDQKVHKLHRRRVLSFSAFEQCNIDWMVKRIRNWHRNKRRCGGKGCLPPSQRCIEAFGSACKSCCCFKRHGRCDEGD